MHLAEMAGTDPVSVYRSLQAAPGEAPMLAGQAVRAAAGRGADPGPGRPSGAAAGAPPRLVLVVDQFEELFTSGGDGDAGRGSGRRSSRRCTRRPGQPGHLSAGSAPGSVRHEPARLDPRVPLPHPNLEPPDGIGPARFGTERGTRIAPSWVDLVPAALSQAPPVRGRGVLSGPGRDILL